jgi:Citrate synthase, C-terminal domain
VEISTVRLLAKLPHDRVLRAAIVKQAVQDIIARMATPDPLLDIALRLEEIALSDDYFVERKLYPNVDFYNGLIYKAMGFSTRMFTVLFALGRLVSSTGRTALLLVRGLTDVEGQGAVLSAGGQQFVVGVLRPGGDVGQGALVGGQDLEHLAGFQEPHRLGRGEHRHRAHQVAGVDDLIGGDLLGHGGCLSR